MNYKKFLGAASAALMIVIVITLALAPDAWAASKYKVLYRFHGAAGAYPGSVSLCQPDLRQGRKSLRHDH